MCSWDGDVFSNDVNVARRKLTIRPRNGKKPCLFDRNLRKNIYKCPKIVNLFCMSCLIDICFVPGLISFYMQIIFFIKDFYALFGLNKNLKLV